MPIHTCSSFRGKRNKKKHKKENEHGGMLYAFLIIMSFYENLLCFVTICDIYVCILVLNEFSDLIFVAKLV